MGNSLSQSSESSGSQINSLQDKWPNYAATSNKNPTKGHPTIPIPQNSGSFYNSRTREEEIASLKRERLELDSKINQLETTLLTNNETINTITQESENYKRSVTEDIVQLCGELNTLIAEKKAATVALARNKLYVDQLVAKCKTLRQSQAESNTTKELELAKKAQEIKALKDQLKQSNDQVQILNQNVENLKEENDKLNSENMAIKMNFKKSVLELKSDIESLKSELMESNNIKSKIERMYEEQAEATETLNDQLLCYKSKTGFKDTEKSDLQYKLNQVTAQLKEAQAALQSHATVQLPVEEALPISTEGYNRDSSNTYRQYDHASEAAYGKSKRKPSKLREPLDCGNPSPLLNSKPIELPYSSLDDNASNYTPATTSATTVTKPQKRKFSPESSMTVSSHSASSSDSEDSEPATKKTKQ